MELQRKIPEEDLCGDENSKVLGISWNNVNDTMMLGVKENFSEAEKITPSKRNILKIIAAIYDPLGILAPVTITLKLLFQEICESGIGWDDDIGKLRSKWATIVKVLMTYSDLVFSRCYFCYDINDPIQTIFLHGFSDAAEKSFSACIYIFKVSKHREIFKFH